MKMKDVCCSLLRICFTLAMVVGTLYLLAFSSEVGCATLKKTNSSSSALFSLLALYIMATSMIVVVLVALCSSSRSCCIRSFVLAYLLLVLPEALLVFVVALGHHDDADYSLCGSLGLALWTIRAPIAVLTTLATHIVLKRLDGEDEEKSFNTPSLWHLEYGSSTLFNDQRCSSELEMKSDLFRDQGLKHSHVKHNRELSRSLSNLSRCSSSFVNLASKEPRRKFRGTQFDTATFNFVVPENSLIADVTQWSRSRSSSQLASIPAWSEWGSSPSGSFVSRSRSLINLSSVWSRSEWLNSDSFDDEVIVRSGVGPFWLKKSNGESSEQEAVDAYCDVAL